MIDPAASVSSCAMAEQSAGRRGAARAARIGNARSITASETAGVHRWLVGDAVVVRVEDSSFALPTTYPVPEWMIPDFAPSAGEIGLAFSTIGIVADGLRMVVDPWLADDNPRQRPDAARHAERLLAELAGCGLPSAEVDVVINTHIDGIGWNSRPDGRGGWEPAFPRARYLFPQAELDAVDRGDPVYGGEHLRVLRDAGVVEAVSGELQLTPSVSLVPAPGHNAGHVAVRIDNHGDLAIIPGHVILSPTQVDDPGYDAGEDQLALATSTRGRILNELADREGLLLTTLLGGPGGGRVYRTDRGFALRAAHQVP